MVWENQVSTHVATPARRQAIIWMACVDDMSLFDRCSLLPVVSSISYWHPFVVVVVVFPGPPDANTWVCQPDTYQHPHFGCWWLSSRVWGGENSTQTTSFAFPPGKTTSTEGKERGKADR